MLDPKSHEILTFLTKKFDEGVKAGTLNTYKSALSFVLGEKISGDPWVKKLMKGFFNPRPVRTRYGEVYDLDPVLHLIETWYPIEGLNLADLTHRLAILLAIVTAHRKQTLSLITLENISKTDAGFEIAIPQTVKTSRPGTCQPLLLLPRFDVKSELCVGHWSDISMLLGRYEATLHFYFSRQLSRLNRHPKIQ